MEVRAKTTSVVCPGVTANSGATIPPIRTVTPSGEEPKPLPKTVAMLPGATGEPIEVADLTSTPPDWVVRPDWVRAEGVAGFGGQPLVYRGEVLGVLAVFARGGIDTGFIARESERLLAGQGTPPPDVLAIAALTVTLLSAFVQWRMMSVEPEIRQLVASQVQSREVERPAIAVTIEPARIEVVGRRRSSVFETLADWLPRRGDAS